MTGIELLGHTCVDRVTGFTGVAVGAVTYLSGCNQVLLMPHVAEDGAWRDGQWFDEQRLLLLPAVPTIVLDNGATPGFDQPAPKR